MAVETSSPLLNLPPEILSQIFTYYYIASPSKSTSISKAKSTHSYHALIASTISPTPVTANTPPSSWSIIIHDPHRLSGLRISGIPPATPLLINRHLHNFLSSLERVLFSGHLIFTTSSTHWRTLSRLRQLSSPRTTWFLDNIRVLRFCSPPLFTSRVPWNDLPGLQTVELDYCHRRANFRLRGIKSLAEVLHWGVCDESIYRFATDSERFDRPVIDDAVDKGVQVRVMKEMSGVSNDVEDGNGDEEDEMVDDGWANDVGHESMLSDKQPSVERERFKLKVIARYQKDSAYIAFRVISRSEEATTTTDSERDKEFIIWTSEHGLRRIQPQGLKEHEA